MLALFNSSIKDIHGDQNKNPITDCMQLPQQSKNIVTKCCTWSV